MFDRISEKIADGFVRDGIVKTEDRELYQYGVNQGFNLILNIATTLIIGLLLNMIWQSVLFMFAYIPIRIFAGGFHAKTPLGCYVLSVVLNTAILLIMKYVIFPTIVLFIMTLVSSVVISLLSPVEDVNKPLDKLETRVYKKKVIIILGIELVITAVLVASRFVDAAICVILALSIVSVVLVAGVTLSS